MVVPQWTLTPVENMLAGNVFIDTDGNICIVGVTGHGQMTYCIVAQQINKFVQYGQGIQFLMLAAGSISIGV